MGDDDQRLAPLEQPVLQPLGHVEVDVVGRLIQEEHVAVPAEYAREGDAHLLSAGELADGLLQIREAQLGQDGLRLIGGGSGVLAGPGGQILQRGLGDGCVLPQHRRLRQIGDGHIPLHGDAALVRLFEPCQKAQEGALAAAVLAYDADPVPVGDRQIHIVHQHLLGEEDGYVIKGKCAGHGKYPFLFKQAYYTTVLRFWQCADEGQGQVFA